MQIAKKQLLGFGGLALVVGLTAFATTLPADAVSTGGDVQVQVQVYGTNTETVINSPLDGNVYDQPEITFSETHSRAYGVIYILEKLNSDGTIAESWDLGHAVTGEDVSGNTSFDVNLNDYGGAGVYVFRSIATTKYGSTKEDAVQFTYKAAEIDPEDIETEGTEVTFKVCYASGTMSIVTNIKNSKGETIKEVITNVPNPDTGGCMDITVDLSGENLDSGKYTIEVNNYDGKDGTGNLIGTITVDFDYKAPDTPVDPDEPDAPNVPDTGSLLSALNISRADFLITGLIAFVAISIAALVVIKKAHKKQ